MFAVGFRVSCRGLGSTPQGSFQELGILFGDLHNS